MKGVNFFIVPLFLYLIANGSDDYNNSRSLLPQFRLNGKTTQKAFGIANKNALETTVRLIRNEKLIALGGIIHPNGYILTKASSCVGARVAETFDGKKYALKIKRRYEENDLAVYQLISNQSSFPFIDWEMEDNMTEGSWVLAAHPSLEEIRVGIKSGNLRKINREGGVMGVLLITENSKFQGVRISEIVPQAAAYRAGLQENDIITHVDNRRVKNKEILTKLISKKDPGDVVRIKLIRKKITKDYIVTLGHRSVTFDLFNRNLQMSGPISKRKDNFSMILQHDLPLSREAMGGPLFNLNGKCIGFNIARVDRITTFALPAKISKILTDTYLNKATEL